MTTHNYVKSFIVFVGAVYGASSWAVPIGIIDSGTDMRHVGLVGKVWERPSDLPSDGYSNDTHGWNFAENNNQVIDYSYIGKFSPDTTKYFEIQLKVLEGTASDEEKKWIDEKKKDKNFIKELSTFGNFVHGTHVAGIASRTAPLAKILAAKIIPTEQKLPGTLDQKDFTELFRFLTRLSNPMEDLMMSGALGMIAGRQTEMLTKVGKYIGSRKMSVANCSFGTSLVQAKMIAKMIGTTLLRRDLTEEEVEKYAKMFMDQVLEKGKDFALSAKSTLFVMAAGNDGSNNDQMGVFPANLKLENTITVAATRGYERLAKFSNYGATKVEIAAPGVGIQSLIPGDGMMAMSGTSQAAPFIAHLAAKIMDENPSLSLSQTKKILMETVDKKTFLAGMVTSGGIANEQRALRAAALSKSEGLDSAISRANREINDVRVPRSILASHEDGDAVELPSLF